MSLEKTGKSGPPESMPEPPPDLPASHDGDQLVEEEVAETELEPPGQTSKGDSECLLDEEQLDSGEEEQSEAAAPPTNDSDQLLDAEEVEMASALSPVCPTIRENESITAVVGETSDWVTGADSEFSSDSSAEVPEPHSGAGEEGNDRKEGACSKEAIPIEEVTDFDYDQSAGGGVADSGADSDPTKHQAAVDHLDSAGESSEGDPNEVVEHGGVVVEGAIDVQSVSKMSQDETTSAADAERKWRSEDLAEFAESNRVATEGLGNTPEVTYAQYPVGSEEVVDKVAVATSESSGSSGRSEDLASTDDVANPRQEASSGSSQISGHEPPMEVDKREEKVERLIPVGGPGGDWQVVNEVPDSAVRQVTNGSCVSACGEMLTDSRIPQDSILDKIGEWSNSESLAKYLRENDGGPWAGGYIEPYFEQIVARGQPWAAEMFPRDSLNSYHHMVIVDGVGEQGVSIRDPWEGSSYTMVKEEFVRRWTGLGVVENG